jgi:hypothetical protein
MAKFASTISIKIDGVDVTKKVVFRETYFTSQANPMQGSFRIVLKDKDHTFDPVAGQTVTCHIDGVPIFGGWLMKIGHGLFFPVTDTSTAAKILTTPRRWVLGGPDYNFLWDKRVLRDLDDIDKALVVPKTKRTVKKAFNHLMNNYIDLPDGLNIYMHVDDIDTKYGDDQYGGLYVGQGKYLREQMDDFSDNAGVVYYIDADFRVHMHEYETESVSWSFTDYPGIAPNMIGFREGEYGEDFMRMTTEALVWGGSSLTRAGQDPETDTEGVGVVFAKYPQAPANDATWHGKLQSAEREQAAIDRRNLYGRWQMAEMNIGSENYLTRGSVKNRAFVIINGPAGTVPTHGIEGGYSRPLKMVDLTWFGHDVPNQEHIKPGYLHTFVFYTQGEDLAHPLIVSLPLRSVKVSFPTLPSDNPDGDPLTYVRFDGQFGTSYSDSRHFWRALKKYRKQARRQVPTLSMASLTANESPNGTRTQFTFNAVFWADSTQVFLNGLLQRSSIDYTWVDGSTIEFNTPPGTGDRIQAAGNTA